MDKEMQQFQDDLMEAVRDMKAGRAARTHRVPLTPAADALSHSFGQVAGYADVQCTVRLAG